MAANPSRFSIAKILNAPCCFCGYNGFGYWRDETHKANCPMYSVGGEEDRIEMLLKAVEEKRLRIVPNSFDVEEYYSDGE